MKNNSEFVTGLMTSRKLKSVEFPQEAVSFYWNNRTKELMYISDIPGFRDFAKFYIAAPSAEELSKYMPDGYVVTKLCKGKYCAEYTMTSMFTLQPDLKSVVMHKARPVTKIVTKNCDTIVAALAELFLRLVGNKTIKF